MSTPLLLSESARSKGEAANQASCARADSAAAWGPNVLADVPRNALIMPVLCVVIEGKLIGDGIGILDWLACPCGLGPRRQEDGDDG